uniref:F-box only protein 43-like n=1 Tax=Petromyzon marinus TaxID=7757 RepID=A0AAJ7TIK7_PETMA|nr:F-box only protein 43-like [Petromyzon marinus]
MSSRPEWLAGLAQRAPPRPQPCNSLPALTRGGKREPSVSPRAVMQLPVAKTRRPQRSKAVSRHNRDDGIKSDRTYSDSCSHTDLSGLDEEEEEGFCDDERCALDRAAVHEDSGLGSSVTNDSKVSREAGDEGFDAPGSSVRSCPGSGARVVAWSRTSMDLDDSPFLPAVTSSWKRDEDSGDSAKSRRHTFAAGEHNTLDELLGKKAEAVESGVGKGTECGGAVGTRRLDASGHGALPNASLFSPIMEKRDSGIGLTPNSSILDYDDGDTSGRDCLDGARASTSLSPRFLKTPQPHRRGRERGASSVFRTPVTALTRTFNLDLSSPSGLWCSPSPGGRDAVPGSPVVDDDSSFRCVFSERRCIVTEGGSDADERGLDGSGDDLTPDLWQRSRRLGRLQRLSTIREGGSQSDADDGWANVPVARHVEEAAAAAASGSPSWHRVVNTRSQQRVVAAKDGVAGAARNAAVHTPPPCVSRNATPPPAGMVSANAVLTPALRLQQEVAWRFCQGLQETTPVGASDRASTSVWRHSPAQLNDLMKQALASVPVAVRDSPSLKQLIGRKMGCKFIDIIAALEEKGLKCVLCQLLGYLSAADHDRLRKVSAVWRAVVDRERALRLLPEEETPKSVPMIWHKENVLNSSAGEDVAGTRWHQAVRPVLSAVQCIGVNAATLPRGSPLAPSGQSLATPSPTNRQASSIRAISQHERFMAVGRTLYSDELLRKCPRCQSPARLRCAEDRALCTRESCLYDFCAICWCSWHGARPCSPAQTVRRGPADALPGSKQSKRNLRRL